MGPLQNEKMRMLLCEGVRFGRDGQLTVSGDVLWKFGEAGRDVEGE
jgi:hypothetical protein